MKPWDEYIISRNFATADGFIVARLQGGKLTLIDEYQFNLRASVDEKQALRKYKAKFGLGMLPSFEPASILIRAQMRGAVIYEYNLAIFANFELEEDNVYRISSTTSDIKKSTQRKCNTNITKR